VLALPQELHLSGSLGLTLLVTRSSMANSLEIFAFIQLDALFFSADFASDVLVVVGYIKKRAWRYLTITVVFKLIASSAHHFDAQSANKAVTGLEGGILQDTLLPGRIAWRTYKLVGPFREPLKVWWAGREMTDRWGSTRRAPEGVLLESAQKMEKL